MQLEPLALLSNLIYFIRVDDRFRHYCVINDRHESLKGALINNRERARRHNLSCRLIASLPNETRRGLHQRKAKRCRELALLDDKDQLIVDVLVEKELIFGGMLLHDFFHLDAILFELFLLLSALPLTLSLFFFLLLLFLLSERLLGALFIATVNIVSCRTVARVDVHLGRRLVLLYIFAAAWRHHV